MKQEVFREQMARMEYPEGIKMMWRSYGKMLGERCGRCKHLMRWGRGKVFATCDHVMKGSDWSPNYTACGAWEEKHAESEPEQ